MFMDELFQKAVPIIESLERAGFEAVFVGGSVRDYLIDRPIQDVDIATSAKPEDVQKLFPKTVPVGIEHGTVLVLYEENSYEVTTYRIEGTYSDFRHPDQVKFVTDLQLDLARRDFTINSMAMTKHGEIIDPFGGQQDLQKKILRTVNKPRERFQEDPLRMMRAFRFMSQLGFFLEYQTKLAIESLKELLEKIAVERIAMELEKLFLGKYVHLAIDSIIETKIYHFLPIFKEENGLLKNARNYLYTPFHSLAETIAFFHILHPAISIEHWGKAYKLSNAVLNNVKNLNRAFANYQREGLNNSTLYLLKPEMIREFCHLVNQLEQEEILNEELMQTQYEQLPIKNRKDVAAKGHDFLEWIPDRKPGPWLSKLIQLIEMEIVMSRLENTKEKIKEWVREWNQREKN
jgi:tRNA nucleotidyltransferase (CCA-adding enzyme)